MNHASTKTLLVFAHRGEAQAFQDASLTQTDIFITGEGLQETTETLCLYLAQNSGTYHQIINLGITGTLHDKAQMGDVYSIRTVYGESQFKSFTSADEKAAIDVVSSLKRVKTTEEKKKLSPIAHMADRELWAVASLAHRFKIPFKSYKLVSDMADETLACQNIQELALNYSQKLLSFYLTQTQTKPAAEEKSTHLLGPDFYLTFTQNEKLKTLLERLELTFKAPQSSFLTTDFLSSIKEKSKLPKERTNLLLEELQIKLNPLMNETKTKLEELVSPLTDIGAKVKFDPHYEETSLTLTMKMTDQKHVTKLQEALKGISFEEIQKTFYGDDHV